MSLKLKPPRAGKSKNYSVRGTYLGIKIDETTGTHRKEIAKEKLREIQDAIERGEHPKCQPARTAAQARIVTFVDAAIAYIDDGMPPRYVMRLSRYFGEMRLTAITQEVVDEAARKICPKVTPATRNRAVYTPVSAILNHVGIAIKLTRPKGSKGLERSDALTPDDAEAIINAARKIDRRLYLLLKVLLYTGARLGEVLAIDRRRDVLLEPQRILWIRKTKNGDPRSVLLREDLAAEIADYIGDNVDGRLFPLHSGGHLKHLLVRAKLLVLGIPCPGRRPTGWRQPPNRLSWCTYHTFRHTWATWMRRYAKIDTRGLVATGNWRDVRSARRYEHVVPREEWQKVEQLPAVAIRGKSVETTN
jgi:integrase